MTDLINKSTRTWTPARTPAARASGGGDSLPASAASLGSQDIAMHTRRTAATASMRIIEDKYMEEPEDRDRMPSGWWIIPFAVAGALIGIGIASLIIRWVI